MPAMVLPVIDGVFVEAAYRSAKVSRVGVELMRRRLEQFQGKVRSGLPSEKYAKTKG